MSLNMDPTRANPPQRPIVIGLVGGIGSGKSAAAAMFAQLGAVVIDADLLGHQVLREPAIRAAAVAHWGGRILAPPKDGNDPQIDRRALADIVFASPAELAWLNTLTHGRIGELISERIELARAAGAKLVVVDAAVMIEAGWARHCDHLVYVHADPPQRAQRAATRGWSPQAWSEREKSQISLDSKASQCEYTIDNSSSLSHLREQVHRVFHQITRQHGSI